jgi:hypothetical protein
MLFEWLFELSFDRVLSVKRLDRSRQRKDAAIRDRGPCATKREKCTSNGTQEASRASGCVSRKLSVCDVEVKSAEGGSEASARRSEVMSRVRHQCVVFSAPPLPAGYVAPIPTARFAPLEGAVERVERPLPDAWRSKRPCMALPAISADAVRALNTRVA